MIFHSIEIHNLFTYQGKHPFDLRGSRPGKNVVLIAGRNGFGKTSFLNSIKLLFTGVTEAMRQSVQRQRAPTVKQYVTGTGDDWWGVMNRHARVQGEKHCGVRVVWEEDGQYVTAERIWTLADNEYEEELIVTAPFIDGKLLSDDAQRFLDQRLPQDYVPFFFFDGEQIQELAEANRVTQQQHIERLLNISHIEDLRIGLKGAVSDWNASSMDRTEQARLVELKSDLVNLENQQAMLQQNQQSLKEEVSELNADIRELDRRLGGFRNFAHQQDEARLKEEKFRLQERYAELCRKVAETLPRNVPLLVNPHLVEQTYTEVKNAQADAQSSQGEVIRQLTQYLPGDLLDRPPHPNPPLTQEQREYYRNRLIKLLEAYAPAEVVKDGKTIALDVRRMDALLKLLGAYTGNHAPRLDRAEDLRQIQAVRGRLQEIEDELTNVSALSATERQAYEHYKASREEKHQLLIDREAERRNVGKSLEGLEKTMVAKETEIADQEGRVNLSQLARRKVDLTKKLQSFFADYKDRLKATRRAEVEESVNRHFKMLMTSNTLIQHIQVDEDFGLHYLDGANNQVGMGNLSAGMKQLAATALLWALKECSGRTLPVIIDTPLARIDRGNQENLLRNYYPNVSQQVIVLPTDSELDEAKYRLLQPHIYAEYQLHNPDGDNTEIQRGSMYPLSEGAVNG